MNTVTFVGRATETGRLYFRTKGYLVAVGE